MAVRQRVSSMLRGSATMRREPFRTAFLMRSAMTGWVSVMLEPTTMISGDRSSSAIELLIAPRPTMTARPATVGACQVRAQLSTLLVPITARENFWNR